MKSYAILIGNGLNRASDNMAWIDMLCEIRKKYGVEANLSYTNLPLEFERIYLDACEKTKIDNVYSLKKDVANLLPNVKNLSLHSEFVSLPIDCFLTTNYDYYLEQATDPNFQRNKYIFNTSERKHSLFRKIEIQKKMFWHIHGEAHCPASICLGYDHYCTYLSKMIAFLTQPQSKISKKPYLRYILENDRDLKESWLPIFFSHDVFIVGLSMSFLEIDLWWLLTYRRRFALENTKYNISNKIHYFYAVGDCKIDSEQISLLESVGVELHPISLIRKNWRKLYQEVYNQIYSIINR